MNDPARRWTAVLLTVALAAGLTACSSASSGSDDDALTGRTCEIFRDIAGDAADGVDTLGETRDRFKDLYDGYGQTVPSDIQAPLRATVAALTSNDVDALEIAVNDLDSACSSRGF